MKKLFFRMLAGLAALSLIVGIVHFHVYPHFRTHTSIDWSGPMIVGKHAVDDQPQQCYSIVHLDRDGNTTSVYGTYCKTGTP